MFKDTILLGFVLILASLGVRSDDQPVPELEMTAIVSKGTLLMAKKSTRLTWRATASISVKNNTNKPIARIPFYFDSKLWTVRKIEFVGIAAPRSVHEFPAMGSGLLINLPTPLSPNGTIEVQFTYEMAISPSGGPTLLTDSTKPNWPVLETIRLLRPSNLVPVPGKMTGETIERPTFFGEFELYIDMFAPAALVPLTSYNASKRPIYPRPDASEDTEFFEEMSMDYRWIFYARTSRTPDFPLYFTCNVRDCRSEEYYSKLRKTAAEKSASDPNETSTP